jgi:hypothetical protein
MNGDNDEFENVTVAYGVKQKMDSDFFDNRYSGFDLKISVGKRSECNS